MKKITLAACMAIALAACNSESKDPAAEKNPAATAPAATGQDAELTQWLGGKMLVSTLADAKDDMWNNLKLNADGTCTDKDNAAAKWVVKDGKFIFQSVMDMKKTIEKRAEDTLVFKSDIGKDEVYVLKPVN